MPNQSPVTTLDARYSEESAQATPWPDAVARLEQAGLFWVSTVRPDGRPHVTPGRRGLDGRRVVFLQRPG
jgi:hypothetical protein